MEPSELYSFNSVPFINEQAPYLVEPTSDLTISIGITASAVLALVLKPVLEK